MAMPELVRGLLEGIAAPNQVRQGKMDPMTGAMLTAGAAPAGALLGRAPAGSLGMNVFHGTPHKFAPEPDFPQGRPRMDKMGSGEGAQAYGPGFYSADAPKVAKTYQSKVSAMQDGPTATIDGRPIDWNDPVETAAFELARHNGDRAAAADFHARTFRGGDANPAVQILRSEQKLPDVTLPGNLYKFDIPDADAAKLLDYDAPISQQPKVVRDAIDRLGFMPDNPDKAAGGDVWFRMRQQLGEDEAAAAMREAGVPGLRYKDAGSRGTDSGDGTRNFVVWDQDVLNRTKVLQRNDEVFENKITPQQMRNLLADPSGA
tara:strand:- start:194 stop:1144 length:951 start_codon:yes stop_codon:yes gene_type:complete